MKSISKFHTQYSTDMIETMDVVSHKSPKPMLIHLSKRQPAVSNIRAADNSAH
jgi:hypothetical protein